MMKMFSLQITSVQYIPTAHPSCAGTDPVPRGSFSPTNFFKMSIFTKTGHRSMQLQLKSGKCM